MNYFSMFSGIGGFEYGIQREVGGVSNSKSNIAHNNSNEHGEADRAVCIGFSEIDKYAKAIYRYHYSNHKNYGNAKDIIPESLPDFNLLIGGFPCQAFSIAGKRGGFDDTRGTLFFDVARILKAKRPEWFLLENVKGLCSHEGGKTLGTIYRVLADLGYTVGWEVVNSCQFGVPQNRERIFIVGHLTAAGGCVGEVLPVGRSNQGTPEGSEQAPVARCFTAGGNSGGMHSSMTLLRWQNKDAGIVESEFVPSLRASGGTDIRKKPHVVEVKSGTWRTHKDGQGFRELENPDISPCIPARAREDGSGQPVIKKKETQIRRLTPVECERLQGFPDGWTEKGIIDGEVVEISDTQRYKCLGNAITTNVATAIITKILKAENE